MPAMTLRQSLVVFNAEAVFQRVYRHFIINEAKPALFRDSRGTYNYCIRNASGTRSPFGLLIQKPDLLSSTMLYGLVEPNKDETSTFSTSVSRALAVTTVINHCELMNLTKKVFGVSEISDEVLETIQDIESTYRDCLYDCTFNDNRQEYELFHAKLKQELLTLAKEREFALPNE